MTTENMPSDTIRFLDILYGQMVSPSGADGNIAQPNPGITPSGLIYPSGPSRTQAGIFSAGIVKTIQGFAVPTTGMAAQSWYPLVRVGSKVLIRKMEVMALYGTGDLTTFTGDITVAFSDAFDGTNFANQVLGPPSSLSSAPANALIVNPSATTTGATGTAAFFAHAFAFGSLSSGAWSDVTYANWQATGGNAPFNVNQPLWQALGFGADPGGFFDIGVFTTAQNSVTPGTNPAQPTCSIWGKCSFIDGTP